MLKLSYSSLNILHTCPHCWLNKVCYIPQPEKPEWEEGKLCHRIIQDHVSGRKIDKRLKHIDITFPVVELKDFDEQCRFEFKFGDYLIIGFVDGREDDYTRFLEIKSSSTPWSVGKFKRSMQRRIYCLADDRYEEAVLITGQRKPELWEDDPPKVYRVPATKEDREEAKVWIAEGIKILEKGDFTQDLDGGVCTNPYCWWGKSCQFK